LGLFDEKRVAVSHRCLFIHEIRKSIKYQAMKIRTFEEFAYTNDKFLTTKRLGASGKQFIERGKG
jgi:hypothetical protein